MGKVQVLFRHFHTERPMGEGVDELAAVIGVFFILRHFNSSASTAFIWTVISAIGIVPILVLIWLLAYAVINRKELAVEQQASSTRQTPPRDP